MGEHTDYNASAYDWCVPLSDLVGKIIIKLEQVNDWSELRFFCSDGTVYALCHIQECCENVYLEDVNGELSWLLNTPILMADEARGETGMENECDRYRWTFYRFATKKGYVDLRFLGLSNGYYSERVDFFRIPREMVTEYGWVCDDEPEYARSGRTDGETEIITCQMSDREDRLRILVPKWAREYGFWLEYNIDVEDITGEEKPCLDTLEPMLREWLEQMFFPAESESLIRDEKRRAEFLGRIHDCRLWLEKLSEEEWEW